MNAFYGLATICLFTCIGRNLMTVTRIHPLVFSIVTMGCAKNEVDSREMKEDLQNAGCVVSDDPSKSDLIIVNTCCFIQSATEESIQAVFDAAGLSNVTSGHAKVVVCGCMPSRYGDDLQDSFSSTEAAAFVPCHDEKKIVSVAARLFPGRVDQASAVHAHKADSYGPSAYIKISDGCDRFCSYCAIPYIRGRYHSFSLDSIRGDVSRAVSGGAKEIVLIAQDTGRWGKDFTPQSSLAALLDSLANEFKDTWFRVMYLQPEGISDDLLSVMAAHENICNYLDIPLQHASKTIIAHMNRHGSGKTYLSMLKHIRHMVPQITLRTTLIVGFPGETDEDFQELCQFVADAEFDYVGIFAYSREEGTKAAQLPDQVPEDIKQDRYQRLRDLADDVSVPLIHRRIGLHMPVLVLGTDEEGKTYGRCQCQAPDVDGITFVSHGNPGDMIPVRISDTLFYDMEGESDDE